MKSQDIVVLFKLISLDLLAKGERVQKRDFTVIRDLDDASPLMLSGRSISLESVIEYRDIFEKVQLSTAQEWEGWDDIEDAETTPNFESYSVRALSASLALSKSEVSNSMNRCREIGLIYTDLLSGKPNVRSEALLDFIKYAIRYVFPAKPGPIVRGIPTAFAAPIMAGKVMSGGDFIPVWPDAYGKSKGQAVTPLYKTVPGAVKKDELLYHFLALVDAIRIGGPREAKVADAMLRGVDLVTSNRSMMLQMLEAVAEALGDELREQVAFVGGCTTVLLITDEYTLESIRGTDDVDLVIHLTGTLDWYRLEEKLKPRGFKNTGQDAVTCRLRLGALKVDFMPTDEQVLGFSNTWFVGGLENAIDYTLPNGTVIKVFAAPWFLAAKLQAYLGRGHGDVLMSNDIEDIIALLDGREELIEEVKQAPVELRRYVSAQFTALLRLSAFQDVIQSTAQDFDRETLIHQRLQALIGFGASA